MQRRKLKRELLAELNGKYGYNFSQRVKNSELEKVLEQEKDLEQDIKDFPNWEFAEEACDPKKSDFQVPYWVKLTSAIIGMTGIAMGLMIGLALIINWFV